MKFLSQHELSQLYSKKNNKLEKCLKKVQLYQIQITIDLWTHKKSSETDRENSKEKNTEAKKNAYFQNYFIY